MRLLLAASVILLAACDTTVIAQQQPEVNSGAIALYDERGNFVREYRDVQDCHAAAIRYNLRNVKENSYERPSKTMGSTCLQP